MNKKLDSIIGKGWSFPPTFQYQSAKVDMVSGVEDIDQSLRVLFSTRIGERVLQQKYGCNLQQAVFQNITLTEKTDLETRLRQAITNYESRITIEDLSIDTSRAINGMIYIQIDYSIDHTNNRRNIVFPYFLEEGTLLPRGS